MQITEALPLLVQDHCTVTWVLHPGGEARYYLSVRHESTQLREMGLCIPPLPILSCYAVL